jgi:O-antigen ligase
LLTRIPGLSIIAAKFARLENSDAGLLNGRQGLWTRAIELFKSNPIFGAGYGSYAAYASVTDAITTSAHNYYLQVAAELGVIGLILYVMAFVSGIISTLKQLKFIVGKQKANDIRILYLCAALAVEIFVLIYSMTSTALMYYPILIPYFIACTVARALRFIKVEELHE